MKSRRYKYIIGRFQQPDPVNGSISSPMSWNLYTYVQSNPLNYIDPFGLMQAWTTVPKGCGSTHQPDLPTADNCPKDCPFDGNKCDCPGDSCDIDPSSGAYICGGETVEVIAKEEPADIGFISDWLAFLAWASQPSMHKPWEFIPNYKDPMVQIMAQVLWNVQPWLDYGESYLEWTLSMIPIGKSLQSFKFVYKVGVPGKEPVHIGLDYARKNIIHYGIYKKYVKNVGVKYVKHIGIWFKKRGTAWKHYS